MISEMETTPVVYERLASDTLTKAVKSAVNHSFGFTRQPSEPYDFTSWSKDYIGGMEAIKMVVEFLQAQGNMDLFVNNAAAKNIYNAIVRIGIERVLLNR